MSTHAAVGMSSEHDAQQAGREAAGRALARLPEGRAAFCLVFATTGYDQPTLLAAIREVTGDAVLSGCSGEGVIAGACSDERDRVVSVLAIASTTLRFEPYLLRDYAADPAARGRELGRLVRAACADGSGDDGIALLVFPDGLVGNCSELLGGIDAEIPRSVVVVGGAAADAMTFERTYGYLGGAAVNDAVAAVLVRGPGRVEVAVSHGCTPIGLERTITRAEGGWLHEIDGLPAWAVFREYLDGDPDDLDAEAITHLCIGEALPGGGQRDPDGYVIRTPMRLDKSNGAMFFPGGGLARGGHLRLTRRDPALIRESARTCATALAARRPADAPAFVLQFDCAGRGRVMFGADTSDAIVRPLQEVLGASTPWIGFHTFGEIAPRSGKTHYHNNTVALCAVYDDA